MLTDEQFGQQLGARLRHETEDVRAAPDLARKLHRRRTRRTWAIGTAIATPVAAAAAIVVVVGTTAGQGAPDGSQHANTAAPPTSGTSAPVRVENVAYVKEQTLKALSQASQYVIHAKNTYESGHYDEWTDKATQRYRNDVYDSSTEIAGRAADGEMRLPAPNEIKPGPIRLRQSHAVSGPDGDQDIVTVDYDLRTWSTGHLTDKRPTDIPDITDADSIRKAITDGTVELVGKENVDGLDTLHLRLHGPKRSYRIDMWVDSTSYLPVREIAAKSTGPDEFPASAAVTATYTWLPRTEENLAKLVLTPPPGFRQVK
jgi:hypothetical protein